MQEIDVNIVFFTFFFLYSVQSRIFLDPTINTLHYGPSIRVQNGHQFSYDNFETADFFNAGFPKLEKSLFDNIEIETFSLDCSQFGIDLNEFLINLRHFLDEILIIVLTVKVHIDEGFERDCGVMILMILESADEANESSLLTLGAETDGVKRFFWMYWALQLHCYIL